MSALKRCIQAALDRLGKGVCVCTYMYIIIQQKRAREGIHGRIWREEREERNDVIIISKN